MLTSLPKMIKPDVLMDKKSPTEISVIQSVTFNFQSVRSSMMLYENLIKEWDF